MAANCATHLLFEDDFTSYTSDADIVAAYPEVYPGEGDGYAEGSTDWGVNFGPDGQPGIKDQVVAPTTDQGGIIKEGLLPRGRCFKVEGRYNHAHTNAILTAHIIMGMQWFIGTEGEGIWQISAVHATGALRCVLQTTSAYGNLADSYFVELPGVFPSNTPQTLVAYGRLSTIIGSPGSFSPLPDGFFCVLVDGVEIISFTGPVWNGRSDINPAPYWNYVQIGTSGAFSDWKIWDSVDAVIIPDADECCGSKASPDSVDLGPTPEPDPTIPLVDFVEQCDGDGEVPIGGAGVPGDDVWS